MSVSEMSAFARTTAPPLSISTRRVFAARGSAGACRPIFSVRRAAARRHPKSCDGVTSSDRASAETFVPGSSDAGDRPVLEVLRPALLRDVRRGPR
jgi:hypothetical protein